MRRILIVTAFCLSITTGGGIAPAQDLELNDGDRVAFLRSSFFERLLLEDGDLLASLSK